jgi:hypothetical protein
LSRKAGARSSVGEISRLRGINSIHVPEMLGLLHEIGSELSQSICPFRQRELTMVASYIGAPNSRAAALGADGIAPAPAESPGKRPSQANCGPMTQQGAMGAHGHEMHPQGFLRLVGCHETSRQKEDAARRVHV